MRNHLREAVAAMRQREDALRRTVLWFRGWAMCDGCNNSCTGSYAGRQCCNRCNRVVT